MQSTQPSLFTRSDTFFGVCEALGQDLGFNPLYLRITLGVLVLWNPVMVLATYAALGVVVLLSRWLFPAARPAPTIEEAGDGDVTTVRATPQHRANDRVEEEPLAIAA